MSKALTTTALPHRLKRVGGRHLLLAVPTMLALYPLFSANTFYLYLLTLVGIYALVAMGLNVLYGFTGQVSLGHGALVAMGAYGTAILTADFGWNFWVACLVGILASATLGSLLTLPALRLSEWHFALVTLALALIVRAMLIEFRGVTGGWSGIVGIPRPTVAGVPMSGTHFYWAVLLANIGVFYVIRNLMRSRFGRGMISVRDGDHAGRASGVSPTATKLGAFVLSAAIAGLAGGLLAALKGSITPDDLHVEFSIFFLIVVIIGGAGTLVGPLLGTVIFFAVPEFMEALAEWRLIIYGVLLLVLMIWAPDGVLGAIKTFAARWRRKGGPQSRAGIDAIEPVLPPVEGIALTVKDVKKSFGGVRALQGVSINVEKSTIHGIVGSNGSGKTTLLNLLSGFLARDGGDITFDGRPAARSPERVAAQGIGRTFQTPQLLPSLSVLENVLLGGYARQSCGWLAATLRTPRYRREVRELEVEALSMLEAVGLAQRANHPAGTLPHGQQRLVEIARALLGGPRLVLLDEPAAGLSLAELDALGDLVRAIRNSGTTVVIVEHHLELVAGLCDEVTVFDRGRVLASGRPEEALNNPDVVNAYLGVSA